MKFYPQNHIVRKQLADTSVIYLTFDDGPCEFTPTVLDVLKKYNAQATFFVIGTQAEKYPAILQRILAEGHRVYSHSYDHDYSHYFTSDEKILTWIKKSISHIESLTGHQASVFRPPAGIITPPLARATWAAGIALILWNQRFYDTVFKLTSEKIYKYLAKAQSGDIVLLHDKQKKQNESAFIESLILLIEELQKKNLQLKALSFNADAKNELGS